MTLDDAQVREVGEALFGLIGLPLSDVFYDRYRHVFKFFEARPHRELVPTFGSRWIVEWDESSYVPPPPTWRLKAWCEWRLERPDAEPLTSALFWIAGNDQRRSREQRRAALAELVASRTLMVESVAVRRDGAFRLGLTGNHAFVVLPGGEYDMEYRLFRGDLRWRLESPADDSRGDLILLQEGFVRRPNETVDWTYLPLAESEDGTPSNPRGT